MIKAGSMKGEGEEPLEMREKAKSRRRRRTRKSRRKGGITSLWKGKGIGRGERGEKKEEGKNEK